MELSQDITISEFDAPDKESANDIDNVSVTMISSNDFVEYVHENSYMSKDKKHKWVDRIPENHGRSRATIVITANLGVTSYAIARVSSIESTFNLLFFNLYFLTMKWNRL